MSTNTDRVSELNWEGEAHRIREEYPKAMTCFGKVLALQPDDPFALRSMNSILARIRPVYYDTSIWVSHLCSDKFTAKCSELIEGKAFQTNTIIVPRLVIMETIQAIRRTVMFPRREKKSKLNTGDVEGRKNNALETIRQFSTLLDGMIAEGRVVPDVGLISPKTLADRASNIFEKYDEWIISWTGKCVNCGDTDLSDDKCEMCGGHVDGDKPAYRGLGYVDFQHVCIAAAHHASEFFSSDIAFKHLAHHEMFPEVTFGIIRGRDDSLRIDKF